MSTEEWGSRFWEWVDTLGHWYFNESLAQRQIRLHWPTGEDFEGRGEEFLQILRQWCPFRCPIDVACELFKRWNPCSGEVTASWALPTLPNGQSCDRPPYLPYLVAFAMAWETEGDFEPNAYYPRLNQIFGQPKTPINTGSFKRANDLWVNLEYWANNIKDGELGVFTAVSLGKMEHIGYPMSQVVLKPSERNQLERIFTRAGLSPDIALSDSEIRELLSQYSDQFSTRVRHSLDTVGSRFAQALFEEVRIELANLPPREVRRHERDGRRQDEENCSQIRLRLTCQMDPHSIRRWFFTTALDSDDMPDATGQGFAFKPGQVDGVLWQEFGETVATPNVGSFTDFAPLGTKLMLRSEDGTSIIWPGHNVRFLSPSYEQAGVYYVEQEFVPDSAPIIVICDDREAARIQPIAIANVPGIPWQGISAWRIDSIQELLQMFPQRRSYTRRSNPIYCIGGIRCYPHAPEFFPFALPRIAVDDSWQLNVQTPFVDLRPLKESHIFEVGIDACRPPDEIVLEAICEGKRTRTLTLSVDGNPSMESLDNTIIAEDNATVTNVVASDSISVWPEDIGKKDKSFGANPGSCLLTFLSTWGQCSYGTWNRVVNELVRSDKSYAFRVARDLVALNHASIQADTSTGQWKRLHVCSGRLRRLPWDMDVSGDRFPQAVVEGQLPWNQLDKMLKSLPCDIDFDITPQPVPYLPPRIRLFSFDSSSLRNTAELLGVHYQDVHFHCSKKNMTSQLENLQWHDGLITPSDDVHYFSPLLLDEVEVSKQRFDDLCRISKGFILAIQTETYGARHYYLCDLDNNRRTLLPQGNRQWARWLCYIAAVKRFFSMICGQGENSGSNSLVMPYIPGTGQVLLPYGLIPPPAITRSLVACTGLLPTVVREGVLVDAVGFLDKSSVESFSHPFVVPRGSSLAVFNNIPATIAEAALGPLGVTLLDLNIGVSDDSSH